MSRDIITTDTDHGKRIKLVDNDSGVSKSITVVGGASDANFDPADLINSHNLHDKLDNKIDS